MKIDIKNRLKNENKNKPENGQSDLKETEKNLKSEIISSILKKGSKTNEAEKPVTFVDLEPPKPEQKQTTKVEASVEQKIETKPKAKIEKPQTQSSEVKQQTATLEPPKTESVSSKPTSEVTSKGPESTRVTQLIKAIENSEEKMIAPSVDMNQGLITYPLLDQIGEDPTNIELLEKLSSESIDVLEKTTYERLAVCPQHPESLSVTVRLYCPKCNSMNITKLHLVEHRRCGYIAENINFETAPDGTITKCPSCKKEIKNLENEIAMPAMWYTCSECNKKFDDVSIKLHCRKYNHDFDTNQSHTIVVPGFRLKNLADTSNSSISPILNQLKNMLTTFGFSAEENYTVTGNSGNPHRINIYGADDNKRTVFIFIKNPNAADDNSELNSKIIEVLDTSPTVAILIGFPSISEKAKAITSNYKQGGTAESK